jgi:hypothetical protein
MNPMLSIVSAWPSIKAEQQRHNVWNSAGFSPSARRADGIFAEI